MINVVILVEKRAWAGNGIAIGSHAPPTHSGAFLCVNEVNVVRRTRENVKSHDGRKNGSSSFD